MECQGECSKTVKLLLEENAFLSSSISSLQATIDKLNEELTQLKDRLGLNSRTSCLPPSKDLYRAKRDRPKSTAKPGGQPGHKAHFYKPLAADEIINVFPTRCKCGHELTLLESYSSQQRVELPVIKPHVKEYRQFAGICTSCKKKIVAPLPLEAGKDLLGPHAKTIICALNGFFHNSKREVQEILDNIFNLPISLGLVSNTAKRVNTHLEQEYLKLQEQIIASPYLHIDETGHRSKGKSGWGWIFTSKIHSLLKLSTSRGKQVLEEVLKNTYTGYVISDRYGAYGYFSSEQRQICWSHAQRNFERFAHSIHKELSLKGQALVRSGEEVFGLKKALEREIIKEGFFIRRIKKLKKRLSYIFRDILRIRGVPQAHRVVKRLEKSFEMLWLFVKNRSIEMTNNLAERQLRKYVLYRKKLLFTWSKWGNEFVERILSLYLSARLSKSNAFMQLNQAIIAAMPISP
jgi:transposase